MSKKGKKEAWTESILEDWGSYMAAKKAKLEDQFQQAADNEFQHATNLFNGIAIFVNGYTDPCADVLKRLMMEHGGIYHHYLRPNRTTHLIASNLPYSKIVQYRKSKNPLPLCKPEWITDSIKANKLLDWRPYLLYSNTSVTQPQLQFENGKNQNKIAEFSAAVPESPHCKIADVGQNAETDTSVTEKKSKPSGAALCSKDKEFLSEFYNNSRLHHISTMGATFKEYVNELRSKSTGTFPGLERLKSLKKSNTRSALGDNESDSDEDLFSPKAGSSAQGKKESVIMHIDMDCFFVSVGLRSRPELRGQPIAVTHAKGNRPVSHSGKDSEEFSSMAEIASCSYEARKAGLRNGMFLGQALKLCPNLKTIKYDFEGYKEVSFTLYNTVASYTLDIEAVSCDEMYADISKILTECNLTPLEFAAIIREEIKEKTGCPVSTGFGSNKLQARLATKKAKPDGQFHLRNKDVESYIGAINVEDIPGVGWSTMQQLSKMNVEVCKDLQKISLGVLQKEFGKKTGEMLFNTCRGIDHSKLNTDHVRKSVSAEVNYGIRFENDNDARTFLTDLSKEVCTRLKKVHAKGRSLTLKLLVRAKDAPKDPAKFMGCGVCDCFTKSKNLMIPLDDEAIIIKDVLTLWEQLQQPAHEIRGIGIQISKLETVKTNALNTNLMKFIAKGKSATKSENKQESPVQSVTSSTANNSVKEVIENPQVSEKKSSIFNNKMPVSNNICDSPKIDESVLAELPDDIRTEVMKFYNHQQTKENGNSQTKHNSHDSEVPVESRKQSNEKGNLPSQTTNGNKITELPYKVVNEVPVSKSSAKKSQPNGIDNYFKQKKLEPFTKAKMPAMQDLDMAVLIELPDDIRNEILNEYRVHQNDHSHNNNQTSNNHTRGKTSKNEANEVEDLNCSYSQVDPEFLAALDNETRNDVKMYYLAKKKEKEQISKKATNQTVENQVKPKKRGRKPKALTSINVPHKVPVSLHKKIIEKNSDEFEVPDRNQSFLENEINIAQVTSSSNNDRREDIRLHCSNFHTNIVVSEEYQEMLITLVNYLFSLPVEQVKRQIQTWINTSEHVNETDLLSLTTYLGMLPKEKRIEDLHVLMKTMHRCMTETGSCIWHETYRKTVENVQQYMQVEYNSNLMLPAIRCNLHECKNDRV